MKRIIYLLLLTLLFSCEKPSECIESTGEIVTRDVPISAFTRLEVYRGIAVQITEGANYSLQIKSGENLIDNVEVKQEGQILKLKDNTSCNWLREYGQTTIYITAPNIEEIYSKTERDISSNGVLTYPNLTLIAVDANGDSVEGAGTSDFHLEINNTKLVINSNNVARFFITGSTNQAEFYFWAGDSRINAENFTVQHLYVFHRGSNDMYVKPMQSISGKIVSTGNVILKNNPPTINVEQLYQGQLIYN